MKRFIRKYRTAKKIYEIGDLVDIKDEKVLENLIANGTVKEFKDKKNPLEKKIEELQEELKNSKNPEVKIKPISFKDLSEFQADKLKEVEGDLGLASKGKKEERVKEIWAVLSVGYKAGSDEEV